MGLSISVASWLLSCKITDFGPFFKCQIKICDSDLSNDANKHIFYQFTIRF